VEVSGGCWAVVEQSVPGFAGVLRQLRAGAKLTQEELAAAASLSPRSVSDLERGIHRTARKDTAGRLAEALGIPGAARALFVAAARGRAPADEALALALAAAPRAFAAAPRALPRDIASFTGRRDELARLLGAIDGVAPRGGAVGIHAIGGMAGIGKTTFAVHAAHLLAEAFPDGQFFLPLHAHTPGQRPVDPADALASLLLTAGVDSLQIPPDLETRAARWRDHVAGRKILLLLDDAASHDQVRPLLPATAGSLVLVTSRRRLTALEDAVVISLDVLPASDAAELLARLAGRPELSSEAGPAGEIIRLCGYLPLAIGMLARHLSHHSAWSADHLASELVTARDRLALMQAENLSVAAAFTLSYAELTPGQQQLFRRLGLVPGPSIDAYSAAALGGIGLEEARRCLNELYDQHLLAEVAPGRYVLHDLLREHARALAAADGAVESDSATERLLDYYLYTAAVAGRHFASLVGYRRPPAGQPPADAPDLCTVERAAAWLEAERPNLHGAADRAAAAGRQLYAVQIPAAISGFLLAHGHVHESGDLHRTALAAALQAGDRAGQAIALGELGLLAWLTGNHQDAAASLERALALYRDIGDLPGQADVLNQIGFVHILTGDYPAAIDSHQQALALARGFGDRLAEADALNNLGRVRQRAGYYAAAAAAQQQALELFCEIGNQLGQAVTLNDLGVLQQETGDYPAATASQLQALKLFRNLGNRFGQAVAHNQLGAVQQLTGSYRAAAASHQQALELHRDLGIRFGQAEALNSLGELSSQTLATQPAREHHTQALAIARSIGMPREEARALEGIGRSYLREGSTDEGVAHLRRALVIYQRIKSPCAQAVEEALAAT
jgi:tetratricopeptide (TPR) repeat protein